MELRNIYKSDINRDINGVIKVAQNDEASIEQELREYIITRELRNHFHTFLDNYEKSLNIPTDKIGVWISGFFGSGKSHFLKMLSYLLSNNEVAGKKAVEYFEDKFDDPMMFSQLERCVSVPTDTILFNIDSKSPLNKDKTAILRVFAKVFYEHMGFYGSDLKIAKLEQFIEKEGKTDAFREAFEDINGMPWVDSRDSFVFFEDDIVESLCKADVMSEAAARNWFNGSEDVEMSIEQLVSEIKAYINSRGKDYRLLFMIDEVGQYIGSDSDLMLNLQTIVEEIGSNCEGRVWVVVTSQEAIDSVTKISGDDFSKIQGRFNTRLSLSSSSVDEVIKKRILAKNENGENLLKLTYSKNSAILKNLFTFNNAMMDLKGYEGEFDFVETYPFVPYQFRLMQNVLAQIRKHGNSGKHLSGGERSMLSGFQEAAQAIQNRDENALISFNRFYNTVHTFLESTIRRVIDRCQVAADQGNGIAPYDVEVLKLLYLIRYVDDIKSNVDNITTLMVETIDADKIEMRKKIQESLDRLLRENYIARNGDTYSFLTDDEQDIAREIKNTTIDSGKITQKISDIIFNDLYPAKKFSYGTYDFPFDKMIDETNIGTPNGGIKLRIVTKASSLYESGEQVFIMKSGANKEAIVVLSDECEYFEEIENSLKIKTYIKTKNMSQLSEAIQSILRGKMEQANAGEKRAKEQLTEAILNGKFYSDGSIVRMKGGSVSDRLEDALATLVDGVYSKLDLIKTYTNTDEEIRQILTRDNQQQSMFTAQGNEEALAEVEQYLEIQDRNMLPVTMGDIQRRFQAAPYGWHEIDIAALVAEIIARQRIYISYNGSAIQPTEPKLVDYLRRRSEIDKAKVNKRVTIPTVTINRARGIVKEYFNVMDVPTDEDGLITYIQASFEGQQEEFNKLLTEKYNLGKYPDKKVVEQGKQLIGELLLCKKDNKALLDKLISMEDDILDLQEDMMDVRDFFKNQRVIFDSASVIRDNLEAEKTYLQADTDALSILREMETILTSAKPYKRISELPELTQKSQETYAKLLEEKKTEVMNEIVSARGEVHQTADMARQKDIVAKADMAFEDQITLLQASDKLTVLDAMKPKIEEIRKQYLKRLMAGTTDPQKKVASMSRNGLCYTAKLTSEQDVDDYLNELKGRLMSKLESNDEVHII